jgi:hydroxybutyrate-dimer hydrolase
VQAGIAATRAGLPRAGLPVMVVHGTDDGLVPQAFSSTPYVAMAQVPPGRDVRYWQVRNAQHFDAFLGFPPTARATCRCCPTCMPRWTAVGCAPGQGRARLPADAVIATVPRAGKP